MRPQTKTPKLGGAWAPRKYLSDHSSISQRLGESITIGSGAVVSIVSDGAIHRFDHPDKRRSNKRGWYVCHAEYGVWGDWATGEQHVIFAQGEHDPEIAQRVRQEAEKRKRDRQAETERTNTLQARQSRQEWITSKEPDLSQHYLQIKGIKPIGLRQRGNLLVVPMVYDGSIVNLQTIAPDGTKRYKAGARKRGCYFPLGRITDDSPLLICEGVATGITLHTATGYPVACAMDCGNLLPAALLLRQKYTAAKIIVCADNDWQAKGNPGITHGKAAAKAVGGLCLWPEVDGIDGATDYNDAARLGSEVSV